MHIDLPKTGHPLVGLTVTTKDKVENMMFDASYHSTVEVPDDARVEVSILDSSRHVVEGPYSIVSRTMGVDVTSDGITTSPLTAHVGPPVDPPADLKPTADEEMPDALVLDEPVKANTRQRR